MNGSDKEDTKMLSTNTKMTCVVASLLVALCAQAPAQKITIAKTWAERGQIVAVDVTLSAPTTMTAALLRLEFDPAMLNNPSAMQGPLVSTSHIIDSHAHATGRVNVGVYPATGARGFTALRGTLFTLFFDVRTTAPARVSPVRVTTVGTPGLPGSNLTNLSGAVVAHTLSNGSVGVGGTAARASWMLYD